MSADTGISQRDSVVMGPAAVDKLVSEAEAAMRERCASIAAKIENPYEPLDAAGDSYERACADIAAKIRSGE